MNIFIVIGWLTIIFVVIQSINTVLSLPERIYAAIHIADILITVTAIAAIVLLSKTLRNSWISIYSFSGVIISWWPAWAYHLIRTPGVRKKGVFISAAGGILTLITAVLLIQGGHALLQG